MSVFGRQIKTESVNKHRKNVHYYHRGGHVPSLDQAHFMSFAGIMIASRNGILRA